MLSTSGVAELATSGTDTVAKLASNMIQQIVLQWIKVNKRPVAEFPVKPEELALLIERVHRGELNKTQGREVFEKMVETGESADAIIKAGGYGTISDRDVINAAVATVLAANPKAVDDLKAGKKKPEAVMGFLRGQVMKQTGGKADPKLVGELLTAELVSPSTS